MRARACGLRWLLAFVACAPAPAKTRTCSIVSSAGSLLERRDGKRIDAHDRVARVSVAPTAGYEKYVGKKTHLRIFPQSFLDARRHHSFAAGLAHAHELLDGDPAGVIVIWVSNAGCDARAAARRAFELEHPEHRFGVVRMASPHAPEGIEARRAAAFLRGADLTTGFAAVHLLLASGFCDEATLYGFGASSKNASYHYWTWSDDRTAADDSAAHHFASRVNVSTGHDFALEHSFSAARATSRRVAATPRL